MSNVRVAVRARPILPREEDANSPIVLEMVGQSTRLFKSRSGVAVGQAKDASKEFVYDFSHWSVRPTDLGFASQNKVFQDLGLEVLASAFKGYNTCIFAYGQTGSGKTYTMMGNESSPGLIPRICEELFARMSKNNQGQVSYRVEVSYMEIYNEKVRDLLQPVEHQRKGDQPAMHTLKLREHPKDGPYVQDLSTHQVNDYTAILNLIHLGNKQRSTAFTKMNDLSSRSHAIFTIIFKQARYSEDMPSETVSKINLVDLAGSERASQTGAEGQRLRESGNINKSLVCLGNVISALAEMSIHPNKKHYIPYRDSALTWLLKDSLGGNSKTIMIATVSPCECSYGETLSTLRYASRAKNIVNKPVVNEDNNVMLIRELRDEIRRLKEIISNGDINVVPPESTLRLAVDLQNKEKRIAALTKNWAENWDNIHKIIEERELALHSEGVKMTVASERPHLLGLDEEVFGAGVVLYYLKNGTTTIGSEGTHPITDISLKANDIEPLHCEIELTEDSTSLNFLNGSCHVNRISVQLNLPTKLSHGDTLQLGSRTYLRFNHPQEAQKLKETSMQQSADKSGMSDDSLNDPIGNWSPLLAGSNFQQHEKLNQLEQERDTLQQQQSELVKDYEERIQSVLEQLKKEEAGKAALQEQLEQLQEQQLTASIRLLSFSASGEVKRPKIVTSTPQSNEEERSTLRPPPPSPTPSKQSVASLSTREVMGQEDSDSSQRSPPPTDWVDCAKLSPYSNQQQVDAPFKQYCVSLTDKEGMMYADDQPGMKPAKSEEYLLVERPNLGTSMEYPGELRSRTLSRYQDNARYDRRRLVSRREKVVLRKKLNDAEEENTKMRRDLIALEYRLQGQRRRRSYAFDEEEEDLSHSPKNRPRSQSVGNASSSSLKLTIPASFLRGYGIISSYHVYEIHINTGSEKWKVCRKYQEFRDYHSEMVARYPQLSQLNVPPSKWVGFRNEEFVAQRRVALERYLQSLVVILACVPGSPFSNSEEPITRERLEMSHRFFKRGHLEADRSYT